MELCSKRRYVVCFENYFSHLMALVQSRVQSEIDQHVSDRLPKFEDSLPYDITTSLIFEGSSCTFGCDPIHCFVTNV